MDVGVVGADGGCDVLEDGRLAGLRRRDDEAALALADGRDEVDGARGQRVLAVLHDEALVGIDGREVGELHAVRGALEGLVVERDDGVERRVLLVLARGTHAAGDVIALAQALAAYGAHADVNIVLAGKVTAGANEAVTIGQQVEYALDHDESLGLEQRVVDGGHQVIALAVLACVDTELDGLGGERLVVEHRELVARGGGDDFLALVVVAVATIATVAALSLALLAGIALLGGLGRGRRIICGGLAICRHLGRLLRRLGHFLRLRLVVGARRLHGGRLACICGLLDGITLIGIDRLLGGPALARHLLLDGLLGHCRLVRDGGFGNVDERELLFAGIRLGLVRLLRRGLARRRLLLGGSLLGGRALRGRGLGGSLLRRRLTRGLFRRGFLLGCGLLGGYCLVTHAFSTFSQSALNFSSPCSVNGWYMHFFIAP